MPISGNPTVTCSGCWLFSPLALPPPETDDISQPPDEVIKELSVKVLLGKEEKTYLLRNVCVSDVYSIEMMKSFLINAFCNEDIQEFGYSLKKKKVWLREDEELSTVVRDLLVKGKGASWCVEKRADNEPTQPHETPGASASSTVPEPLNCLRTLWTVLSLTQKVSAAFLQDMFL